MGTRCETRASLHQRGLGALYFMFPQHPAAPRSLVGASRDVPKERLPVTAPSLGSCHCLPRLIVPKINSQIPLYRS